MLATKNIHALTDFLRNHKIYRARLKETGVPEVLTVNGKAEVVIQDADSYYSMLEQFRRMETFVAVSEGIASAERGELKDAAQVVAETKAKYGIG